jgi:hypothetical protein
MLIRQMKLTAAILATVLLLGGCSSDPYGAKVILQNGGLTPLNSVVVRVTGNSYSIGVLPALGSRSVKTYPTGESHIVIEYIGASGEKKELTVECYFEPGYRNTINVRVTAESAVRLN